MHIIYLLLGSNIGDRLEWLKKAREGIEKTIGHIYTQSSVYQTEPWGFSHKEDFYNQVIIATSDLHPAQILKGCLQIEKTLGRRRKKRGYEARNIDIDILIIDDLIIETEGLKVPHPRLHERLFTLVPLCELAPYLIHPVLKKSMNQLLLECNDKNRVSRIQ